MSVILDSIRKKLELYKKKQGGSYLPSGFWKPRSGKNIVRIINLCQINKNLNEDDVFKNIYIHYGGLIQGGFVCKEKTFGEEGCPVCGFVKSVYENKDENASTIFKDLSAKSRFYIPIIDKTPLIDRESGDEFKPEILYWSISEIMFMEKIAQKMDDKDEDGEHLYGDITDLKTGRDIQMEHRPLRMVNGQKIWGKTEIDIRPKASVFLTDTQLASKIIKSYKPLMELLEKAEMFKTDNEIKKALEEYLSPSSDHIPKVDEKNMEDRSESEDNKSEDDVTDEIDDIIKDLE